ncbi:acetylglutamate kinase [Rhodocaloribacter litoris]|uniref:acetylglutamate kinase n=1 Tax=Rhodocaloribacter litoris TaxID=2558931 RepID=UPI001422385A|nr:acetylglutamate kinase [Rhodocaloribacter litoris]QXD14380.1 acetylglutamate kinase [Rhodocaloribacter litoris]
MSLNPHGREAARPVVVKVGGALVAEPERLDPLWAAVARLRETTPVVLVHGGGPQATAMARRLGHEPRIVHGRRVTSDLDLDIIRWTLRGELNTHLVAQAHRHGVPAAGLSGADGGLVRVVRRPPWQVDGETVDFGWVGDVEAVRPGIVAALLAGGFVPVIAPLGIDAAGQVYNVNADTVARHLATALGAAAFLLVTEAGGLRRTPSDPASLLDRCDAATFERGVADGWIQGGMRVKLAVAFEALRAGIPDVYVLAPDDLLERRRATRILP